MPTQAIDPQALLPAAAVLPHRLMEGWLECHLRLVEMTFTLVSQQLTHTELEIERTLELCAELSMTGEQAEQARLCLAHAMANLQHGIGAAQERCEIIKQYQAEAISMLAHQTCAMWADVTAQAEARRPPA
jgi:hypothetical protein